MSDTAGSAHAGADAHEDAHTLCILDGLGRKACSRDLRAHGVAGRQRREGPCAVGRRDRGSGLARRRGGRGDGVVRRRPQRIPRDAPPEGRQARLRERFGVEALGAGPHATRGSDMLNDQAVRISEIERETRRRFRLRDEYESFLCGLAENRS